MSKKSKKMEVVSVYKKRLSIFFLGILALVKPLGVFSAGGWQDGITKVQNNSGLSSKTLTETITGAMMFLVTILAVLAIIGFVISGILYVTSAGNEDRMETAKRGMMYSIIGVVVGAGGFILTKAISVWLEGSGEI